MNSEDYKSKERSGLSGLEMLELNEESFVEGHVLTKLAGSLSDAKEGMLPFSTLWRMKWRMHSFRTLLKKKLKTSATLSNKHTIGFPNTNILPDNEDDDIPWHDESPEEYD
jgi:hypothetical protein